MLRYILILYAILVHMYHNLVITLTKQQITFRTIPILEGQEKNLFEVGMPLDQFAKICMVILYMTNTRPTTLSHNQC